MYERGPQPWRLQAIHWSSSQIDVVAKNEEGFVPFVVAHHGPHTDRASPSYSSVPERFKRGQGDRKVDGEVNEIDSNVGGVDRGEERNGCLILPGIESNALPHFSPKQSHFEVADRVKPPFWQHCIGNSLRAVIPWEDSPGVG